MELALLSISFIVFLVLGVPVSFALGLTCVLTYLSEGLPADTAMQMMVSGMNVFSFLAIAVLHLLGRADVARRHRRQDRQRLRAAWSAIGSGGLGLANVVASTLFGGVSGSPVADTSAMGGVMIPHDEARGLQRRLRGQRHDARVARGRADADLAQHDHLRVRGAGHHGHGESAGT